MLSGEDRTTSISEEVALAVTSFEELHNSGKHHSHCSLNSVPARVQCNGTGLKETQEITLGEQQELLESEYMCNRVSVGTSEATEET